MIASELDPVVRGFVVVVAGLYGLLIGSFLTVVADRVPRGESIVRPHSACGSCGLRLGVRDLVPVFSWLVLRGRCRQCRTPIGVEPLIIEIVNGSLFALMAWRFGLSWQMAAFCVLSAGLVSLSAIDIKTKRLPRRITYVTAAIGAPLLVVAALVRDEPQRVGTMLLGATIALAIMGAIYLASRGQMGDGDVRLSPLLGLFLGWLNPGVVPLGLFFGFLLGSIVGVAMMVGGGAGRKTALPFGPFLAAGTIVAVFAGQPAVDLLLHR